MARPEELLRGVVGGRAAEQLESAWGLLTVRDLLWHLPTRYVERGRMSDLADLVVGEQVTVLAEVRRAKVVPSRDRTPPRLELVVGDGRSQLTITFFRGAWRADRFPVGTRALFAGEVGRFRRELQMVNPEVMLLEGDGEESVAWAGQLLPIYPTSKGVKPWVLPNAVRLALDTVDVTPDDDPLPPAMAGRAELPSMVETWTKAHRPQSWADLQVARRRLATEEALAVQVVLAQRRALTRRLPATPRPLRNDGLLAAFDRAIPYELTAGQRAVGEQLAADLALAHPMHRLLQGEVGSGKTVVALRAMLAVIDAGGQAALLAPTEVLAAQHARNLTELLGPLATQGQLGAPALATRVVLLTGSLGARARRAATAEAADGRAGIVVGTHALLSEGVDFADLGLVVVDEQHRFGVEQRDALRARGAGATPHLLVMTATPIPRTVAMTVFGDLEVSTLTELPRGRQPIDTFAVHADRPVWVERMWQRVHQAVARGEQAFVVCPRIEAGDDPAGPGGAAVEVVAPALTAGPLAGLRLGVLHGRLSSDAKDEVMARFRERELEVLVATTVIEVGVDVPNASVMVLLDADRFGISQLHQLRGRVGRGSAASTCFLVSGVDPESKAWQRLSAVEATLDGAALAEVDLEQRREGDVLGVAQSGRRRSLRRLDLRTDRELIERAREDAVALVADDPELRAHPALAALVRGLVDDEAAEFLEKG